MNYAKFIERYKIQVDENQEKAILSINENLLLLAIPGSGKTTTMITRLGYMTKVQNINPSSIIAATYTRKAKAEMEKRFSKVFDQETGKKITFCTINSLCYKVIEKKYSGYFPVIEEPKRISILKKKFEKHNEEREPSILELSTLSNEITKLKNSVDKTTKLKTIEWKTEHFIEIFHDYNDELKKQKLIDYDDQLIIAHEILSKDRNELIYWKSKYKYICVDEAQDTSELQHAIIKLIAGDNNFVFMVGDEDQSIYGFRGAFPEYILSFTDKYPKGRILTLTRNYRSDVVIVEKTKKFINQNSERHKKDMWPYSTEFGEMSIELTDSRISQYYSAFTQIRNTGWKKAILYRNNLSGVPLMYIFEKNNIDYSISSAAEDFLKSSRIAYLINTLMFSLKPDNIELFNNILGKYKHLFPFSIIRNAVSQMKVNIRFLDLLLQEGKKFKHYKNEKHKENCIGNIRNLVSLFKSLSGLSTKEAIEKLIEYDESKKNMKNYALSDNEKEIIEFLSEQDPDIRTFVYYFSNMKERTEKQQEKVKDIHLSTIHSAKGMEFDHVYLVDCIDGIFPSVNKKEAETTNDASIKKTFEEERRIFYVGMTRARKKLIIYRIKGESQVFLDELDKIGVKSHSGEKYSITHDPVSKEIKTFIDGYSEYSDYETVQRLFPESKTQNKQTKNKNRKPESNDKKYSNNSGDLENEKRKADLVDSIGTTNIYRTTAPIEKDHELRKRALQRAAEASKIKIDKKKKNSKKK